MSNDLTIVTWLWNGWRPLYAPEHVYRMRDMLAKHLSVPHRFVCVTDQPDKLPDIETIQLWQIPHGCTPGAGHANCYARLRLFHEWAAENIGPRLLSIDLDAIVLKDFADILPSPEVTFMALRANCCEYNGSLWMVTPGAHNHLWTKLSGNRIRLSKQKTAPNGRPVVGSDQAWMAYMLPGQDTWGPEHGIYWHHDCDNRVPADARIVFFPGTEKPWDKRFASLYWSA